MLKVRRMFMRFWINKKNKNAITVQKFLKGYLAAKVWREPLHRIMIDKMMTHFGAIRA